MQEMTPGGYLPNFPIERSLDESSEHDRLISRLKRVRPILLGIRKELLNNGTVSDKSYAQLGECKRWVHEGDRRKEELEARPEDKLGSAQLDELAGRPMGNGHRNLLTSAVETMAEAIRLTEDLIKRESGRK